MEDWMEQPVKSIAHELIVSLGPFILSPKLCAFTLMVAREKAQ